MLLTNILSKEVLTGKVSLALLQSTVTGHKRVQLRRKEDGKMEMLAYDPYVGLEVVYKELKKLRRRKSRKDDEE